MHKLLIILSNTLLFLMDRYRHVALGNGALQGWELDLGVPSNSAYSVILRYLGNTDLLKICVTTTTKTGKGTTEADKAPG